MTTIDVVIPTYDDDIRLSLTLWGYSQQTDPAFRVHVVNDGGPSSTAAVVANFKDQLDLVYHYVYPPSADYRPSKARNLGISAANTDRVLCSDCDTIPCPTLIASHREFGANNIIVIGPRNFLAIDNVPIIYAHFQQQTLSYTLFEKLGYHRDERLRQPKLIKPFLSLSQLSPDTVDYAQQLVHAYLCHSCNISYSRPWVQRLGGFCERYDGFRFGEDHDLALRLLRAGGYVCTLPQQPVYHLGHPPRAKEDASQLKRMLNHNRRGLTPLIANGGPLLDHPPILGHIA